MPLGLSLNHQTWRGSFQVCDKEIGNREEIELKHNVLAVCGLAAMMAGAGQIARADDEASQLASLINKVSPAVVTLKIVLKSSAGQGRDQESRMEMQGIVVDKSGLVMVTNTPFNPGRYMSVMGRGGGGGNEMKSTPTDIKVLFAQEDKEYSAFIAATDTKLDLAFIKIEGLGDKQITAVDFSGTASAGIGDRVISVSRLEKGFDYAPFFSSSRISGAIDKPRKAYMIEGGIGDFGLPVYSPTGAVLGVITTVDAGVSNDSSEGIGFSTAMRYAAGGGLVKAFVIPAATVNALITQAKIKAVAVGAERAKNKNKPAVTKAAAPPAKTSDKAAGKKP